MNSIFERSGLWSLNAVLQLTQDLTRIHNVDEHASWSEDRAAISQVAALYQSEVRTDQKSQFDREKQNNSLFRIEKFHCYLVINLLPFNIVFEH